MSDRHIAISYSRRDLSFVKKLRTNLKRLKFRTWLDVEDLAGGDAWANSIDEALRGADALVVVMSRNGTKSRYVAYEWAFALGAGVRVVPVLAEKVKLHPRLKAIQYVDFTRRGKGWLRLVDALRADLTLTRPNKEPGIEVRFKLKKNGRPQKRGKEYVMLIAMINIPQTSQMVTYKLHDPSFETPKWTERNRQDRFFTEMSSYGDVLLTAKVTTPTQKLDAAVTLFEGLRASHGGDKRPAIRKALKYIEQH